MRRFFHLRWRFLNKAISGNVMFWTNWSNEIVKLRGLKWSQAGGDFRPKNN